MRRCVQLTTQRFRSASPLRTPGYIGAFSSTSRPKRTSRLPKKDVVTVSEEAAIRIRDLIEKKNDPTISGIRLGVRSRGCNGLSFVMDYQQDGKEGKLDEKVSAHGVDVYIDSKAVFYIIGTKMDWVEDDLRAEFTFENPNAKGQCGCGESFNV
ncbi:hypothetical protein AAMO2058_000356800 [Amorphochlora amoebiformis]|mmetsp:Transcript_13472/g.21305  ORF Transcript_13472/g.21305 Transcript_13472/m.21305 type:complete len:154 (-) Transcript_13472:106-567(-)|eukprot:82784-Amorphochlora_amoeboformis.AAC.1